MRGTVVYRCIAPTWLKVRHLLPVSSQGPPTGDFVCHDSLMPIFFNVLAILFALLTAGAYWYGTQESLFWAYPWYDIMLHLMGGLSIGSWASAVVLRMRLRPVASFMFVIGAILVLAGAWEVFEYVAGLVREEGYLVDTTQDILNGLAGGLTIWIFATLFYKNSYGQ
jgi:hypothetical protein